MVDWTDTSNLGGMMENIMEIIKQIGYSAFDVLMTPFRYVANMNDMLKACILGFLMAIGLFIIIAIWYSRRKLKFVRG